jgi:hypothetical protein
MKRTFFISILPASTVERDSPLAFTIWVDLARPGVAADVQIFRRGLDRYLESYGMTRTLNPLHALICSPERSLTLNDQINLLVWMIEDRRALGVEIGALQLHTGIPSQRDRVAQLPAMFEDQALVPMASLYKAGRLYAEQVVEMLGGYHAPVALH